MFQNYFIPKSRTNSQFIQFFLDILTSNVVLEKIIVEPAHVSLGQAKYTDPTLLVRLKDF